MVQNEQVVWGAGSVVEAEGCAVSESLVCLRIAYCSMGVLSSDQSNRDLLLEGVSSLAASRVGQSQRDCFVMGVESSGL